MTDVLRELSTLEIVKLSEFYKAYQDEAPHIHSYLQTALRWREKEPDKCLIQVYVPQEGWTGHGTFVSIGHFSWEMIIVYTLEKNGEILRNALSQTQHFDYAKKSILYYALHEKHIPIVDMAMCDRGLNKLTQEDTNLWKIDREAGVSKTISVPESFVMASLKPEHSFIVNDIWPHKEPGSESYVKTLIQMNGGYGLFTKEDNTLVAWALKSQLGQIALLQVSDEFKRRGLAMAIINKLTKEIANDGFPVIATIITNNVASQALFTKAGFVKMFLAGFITYK